VSLSLCGDEESRLENKWRKKTMADQITRRDFIALTGGALGASLLPVNVLSKPYKAANPKTEGRIVIVSSQEATSGSSVNEEVVQKMVDEGLKRLTGLDDTVAAIESLFDGIDSTKKIAIKPNLLNSSVPTRKEAAKAVTNRLVQMLGGTYQADNVHFYERHTFSTRGYTNTYFGDNFHFEWSDFTDRGNYIFCDGKDRPYAKTLHDCDYLINMPVLKDHGCGMNFTLSMKNHLGTVNPGGSLGICGNEQATLDIIASDVVRTKTKLIILDALYGVYSGGPGGSPMSWQTFPANTPNRILLSTDPVIIDFWGRRIISAEREARGMWQKPGNYIERAASPPFNAGIADINQMEVIEVDLDSTSVPEPTHLTPDKYQLFQNFPNPFNNSTNIRFQLKSAARVQIEVFDMIGRKVTTIVNADYPAGIWATHWRGCDDRGWTVSSGNYICRIRAGNFIDSKIMTFAK